MQTKHHGNTGDGEKTRNNDRGFDSRLARRGPRRDRSADVLDHCLQELVLAETRHGHQVA